MKILYLRFALVGLLFKGGFVSNMRIKILNLRFCAAGFLFKGGLVFCLYVHASSLWSTVFGLEEISCDSACWWNLISSKPKKGTWEQVPSRSSRERTASKANALNLCLFSNNNLLFLFQCFCIVFSLLNWYILWWYTFIFGVPSVVLV